MQIVYVCNTMVVSKFVYREVKENKSGIESNYSQPASKIGML